MKVLARRIKDHMVTKNRRRYQQEVTVSILGYVDSVKTSTSAWEERLLD